uniref:Immunoglobulin V-set domain-containing protein n=1 Tax=Macaca fascicularis TaxID=9541 RepID=A0A7N9D945_MACFA
MPSRETQGPHASARVTLPWAAASTVVWSIVSGSMDTEITQTPKYLVTGMRSKRMMKREHLGHDSLYWLRQKAKKSLVFMFYYNCKELTENKTVPSHFTPECPDSSRLYLHVFALQPEDSALCLCTSSQDTALHSHRLPVHKPPPKSSQRSMGAARSAEPQHSVQHSVGPRQKSQTIILSFIGCDNAKLPRHLQPGA